MIALRAFGIRYPGFTLGPLDAVVSAGERVAVVGANGAGKSTTLNGLCGRLPGYHGSALVDGHEVRKHPVTIRSRVGFVPERMLGFGWMSVAEHLRLLSRLYPGWDEGYARELRKRLDVPAETRLANLSKGNQVKLSLVTAEAFRPPLLVLDEPTSGVDPLMRDELLALLDDCAPPGGERTVIFSSHILEDVERMAGRVLLLREGRVVDDTPVDELRAAAPDEPLTAVLRARLAGA